MRVMPRNRVAAMRFAVALWSGVPWLGIAPAEAIEQVAPPVPIVFDTDIGNDIDDALALSVLHALESRGACRLLAVTISKDNALCVPFVDLVNTFYGRGDLPIGMVRRGFEPTDGTYLRPICEAVDGRGQPRYPRDQSAAEAPEAVDLLRQVLATAEDGSVVLVVVGFSTNIARLIDSPPDAQSSLTGRDLVAKKCRLLSIMAGMFRAAGRHKEYNVYVDEKSARRVYEQWPTPIVASGFEIGSAIKIPAISIEQDYRYCADHPVRDAYCRYQKMPYDREAWDLTSVLYAVWPDRGYFGTSAAGTISVDQDAITQFAPLAEGRHRYLTVDDAQIVRVREALVQLASQPPDAPPPMTD